MRMWSALPVALLVVALVAVQSHAAADEEPAVRVFVLGDSITKGVRTGVLAEETFGALLQSALREEGVDAQVINAGIGGERADQALARIKNDIISKRPALVTIMYGTNDSYVDAGQKKPRVTADEYCRHLTTLIDAFRDAGITAVLMTSPRWAATARNGAGENPNRLLEEYVQVCRGLATKRKLPLVDHFADWTDAEREGIDLARWTTDGCHPNPEGHRRMAKILVPVVLEALAKSPR